MLDYAANVESNADIFGADAATKTEGSSPSLKRIDRVLSQLPCDCVLPLLSLHQRSVLVSAGKGLAFALTSEERAKFARDKVPSLSRPFLCWKSALHKTTLMLLVLHFILSLTFLRAYRCARRQRSGARKGTGQAQRGRSLR